MVMHMSDMDERNNIVGDSGTFDESESAELVDSSRSEAPSPSDSASSDAEVNVEGDIGTFDSGLEPDVELIDGSRSEDSPSDEPLPEPATSEPATSEPVVSEPVAPEPAVLEPTTPEPATPEPVVSEPVVSEPTIPEPVASESPVDAYVPSVEVKPSDDKPASDKTDKKVSVSDSSVSQDDVSESVSSMSFSQALSESVTIASSGKQVSTAMTFSITKDDINSQKEKTDPYVFNGPDGNTYITDNVNTLRYDSESGQYFKYDPVSGVNVAVDDATVSGYFGNSRIVNGEISSVQDRSQSASEGVAVDSSHTSEKTRQDKTISSKSSKEGAYHNDSNDKRSYNDVGSLASAFETSDANSKRSMKGPMIYYAKDKEKVRQMQYETAKTYLNISADNDKNSVDTEFGV